MNESIDWKKLIQSCLQSDGETLKAVEDDGEKGALVADQPKGDEEGND